MLDRPEWDVYFLDIARAVSRRSPDQQRQVGAVIVREDFSILATGYNGFLRGQDDSLLGSCEEGKHQHIIHAEINAMMSAARHGAATDGSYLYCTLSPCYNCARLLRQAGICDLIFAEKHEKAVQSWISARGRIPEEKALDGYFVWTW